MKDFCLIIIWLMVGLCYGYRFSGYKMILRNDCTWHAEKTFALKNYEEPLEWNWRQSEDKKIHCDWAKQ